MVLVVYDKHLSYRAYDLITNIALHSAKQLTVNSAYVAALARKKNLACVYALKTRFMRLDAIYSRYRDG